MTKAKTKTEENLDYWNFESIETLRKKADEGYGDVASGSGYMIDGKTRAQIIVFSSHPKGKIAVYEKNNGDGKEEKLFPERVLPTLAAFSNYRAALFRDMVLIDRGSLVELLIKLEH